MIRGIQHTSGSAWLPESLVPERLAVPGMQVAEELAKSEVQVIAMLRRGDIRAIKLGGRGQWRVERVELEASIQRAYEQTERTLRAKGDDS